MSFRGAWHDTITLNCKQMFKSSKFQCKSWPLLSIIKCVIASVHPKKVGCYLPYVQDIIPLVVNFICVQDDVAVTTIKVAMPLRLHRDQLQILYPPHLWCTTAWQQKDITLVLSLPVPFLCTVKSHSNSVCCFPLFCTQTSLLSLLLRNLFLKYSLNVNLHFVHEAFKKCINVNV